MSSPRVSVLMPAFDAAAYIGEAIQSVVEQTVGSWELIVVDDGSTDDTAAIAEAVADDRLRVIRAPHSGLPAVGRNIALRDARGELVAFLDADDAWLPEKLEAQLAILDTEPEVGVVHCAAVGAPALPQRGDDLVQRLLANNDIYNSSVVVRRALLDEHGALDESPELRGSEDYELWLRLAPHTRFAFVERPLIRYRTHPQGLSASREAMALSGLAARMRAAALNPGMARRDPQIRRSLGISRCIAGVPGRGRADLLAAVRKAPGDVLAWRWLALSLLPSRAFERLRR